MSIIATRWSHVLIIMLLPRFFFARFLFFQVFILGLRNEAVISVSFTPGLMLTEAF